MIDDLHVVLFFWVFFLVQHGSFFTPDCIKVLTLLVGKWLQFTKTCNQFWGMFHGSITTFGMVNIIPLKCFWQVLDVFFQKVVERGCEPFIKFLKDILSQMLNVWCIYLHI